LLQNWDGISVYAATSGATMPTDAAAQPFACLPNLVTGRITYIVGYLYELYSKRNHKRTEPYALRAC